MDTVLGRCRVVLVNPRIAGNLGGVARVMRNMGLADLVLVAPEADPADPRARQQSTHGESILEQARIVPDLASALGDCVFVAGTSARIGGLFRRQAVATPEEVMPRLVQTIAEGHPAALVFGTEPGGLTNNEVSRCHYLIHIPADPGYPALNLAQAVGICLYVLRRSCREVIPVPPEPRASFADQEFMFDRLRKALDDIHFLYGPKADSLMHALRHLLGRAGPTTMEVDVLLGLARQIEWFAGQHPGPATG